MTTWIEAVLDVEAILAPILEYAGEVRSAGDEDRARRIEVIVRELRPMLLDLPNAGKTCPCCWSPASLEPTGLCPTCHASFTSDAPCGACGQPQRLVRYDLRLAGPIYDCGCLGAPVGLRHRD